MTGLIERIALKAALYFVAAYLAAFVVLYVVGVTLFVGVFGPPFVVWLLFVRGLGRLVDGKYPATPVRA